MKYMALLILIITLSSCIEPKPEFYKDGKAYYTSKRCVKSHTETRNDYHYGYYLGKFRYHYGPHTVTVCDSSTIDTIQIKDN